MEFEWHISKATRNLAKHGVSFEEATEVFADRLSSTVADPDHSVGEGRFLIFGTTATGRHLAVAFTERGDRIRVVSARLMTRSERKAYEQ
jgi:uncharacterized DUF497 family protein